MRGADTFTESLFTLRKLEDFVPAEHPLRPIRQMVNAALVKMDALFSGMYEADLKGGRPSIAPKKLLRTMLVQVFYSLRSEREVMEQTRYNLLFRWFIGLSMDDAVWLPTVFTKNRERLISLDPIFRSTFRIVNFKTSSMPISSVQPGFAALFMLYTVCRRICPSVRLRGRL